eukprot:3006411-Amphidinium_carterae.1
MLPNLSETRDFSRGGHGHDQSWLGCPSEHCGHTGVVEKNTHTHTVVVGKRAVYMRATNDAKCLVKVIAYVPRVQIADERARPRLGLCKKGTKYNEDAFYAGTRWSI